MNGIRETTSGPPDPPQSAHNRQPYSQPQQTRLEKEKVEKEKHRGPSWLVRLFHRMKDKVLNKLSRAQYDQEATWSTRTWLALQTQRMSIAVHFATAYQIARELDLARPEDAAAKG